MRLYRRALRAGEVQALGKLKALDDGMTAYWRLDGPIRDQDGTQNSTRRKVTSAIDLARRFTNHINLIRESPHSAGS